MEILPAILGAFLLCGMPVLCFAAGMWYAKHGSPVAIQWRGFRGEAGYEDED